MKKDQAYSADHHTFFFSVKKYKKYIILLK